MYIESKYKPKTLKQLFHKNVNIHIKKWIDFVCRQTDNFRHTLVLYGPNYSGKRTNIKLIFKKYSLIEWHDSLVTYHCARNSPIFQTKVFVTMSNTNKTSIIEDLRKFQITSNNNVPVIIITNSQQVRDTIVMENKAGWFKYGESQCACSVCEYFMPSLLELTKLVTEIKTKENLNLDNDSIKYIITKCDFNTQRIFNTLEMIRLGSGTDTCKLLNELECNSISSIEQTVDHLLLHNDTSASLEQKCAVYESNILRECIFSEYTNTFENEYTNDSMKIIADIADKISFSDQLEFQSNTNSYERVDDSNHIIVSVDSPTPELQECVWVSCIYPSYLMNLSNVNVRRKLRRAFDMKNVQIVSNYWNGIYLNIKKCSLLRNIDMCYDLSLILRMYIPAFDSSRYERKVSEHIFKYKLYEIVKAKPNVPLKESNIDITMFRSLIRSFTLNAYVDTFLKKISKKKLLTSNILDMHLEGLLLKKKISDQSKNDIDTETFKSFFCLSKQ